MPHISPYSDPSLGLGLDKMLEDDLLGLGSSADKSSSTHGSHTTSSGGVQASSIPTECSMMSLSPDALMSYCESRLGSLDTQMNQIMASQQANASATSALNTLAGLLNDLPAPTSATPPKVPIQPAELSQITRAYRAAEAACPQLAASLNEDLNALSKTYKGDPGFKNMTVDSGQVTTLDQNLKNDTANLNSNSEMIMINLQSLMSQRQTAVQLTTNLVQALGDQASSITKNIGE